MREPLFFGTPTPGDDVLANDPFIARETIDALGGNDQISLTGTFDTEETTVIGGAGTDTLTITLSGGQQFRTIEGAGFDGSIDVRINSTDTWRASWQSIENLTIIGAKFFTGPVTTGASNDTLRLSGTQFSQSAGIISTGAGEDAIYLTGEFSGNSTRVLAGAGNDIIDLSGITNLFGFQFLTTDLRGGAGDDTVIGSNFRDQLIGDAGVDRLVGGGDNDTLNGGAGADTMEGGAGNDRYAVDNSGDRVIEAAGGGSDTILADISYVLTDASEVENLTTLTPAGTAGINFTGNALANQILGNAGANVINGGGAGDDMRGGAGDDTYYVDNIADRVTEAAGGGFDRVYSTAPVFRLTANNEVEFLSTASWTSTDAQNLTGSGTANRIFGNAGANTLDGAGGADLLYGLGGDDIFFLDLSTDYAIEVAGGGADQVYTAQSYSLRAGDDIEIVIASTAGITLVGNEIANRLQGAGGAEIIDGGRGRDLLYGLGGADVFRFTSLGEANADTIVDFLSGTDRIALARTAFAGLAAGPLGEDALVIGTTAQDANDRILYDSTNGLLYFDRDGTGSITPVVFAQLDSAPAIAATDIVII